MQDEVREAALRLLDYQDRSAGELRDRLKKKSYSAEDVEETVRALQEGGLVDDRRYASVFAQSKIAAGKDEIISSVNCGKRKFLLKSSKP